MNAITPIEYSPRPTPVVAALRRIEAAAARVDHAASTADLMQQAVAMRRMGHAALIEILREIGDDERAARAYLRSKSGRTVLTLAGYDPDICLSRFTLQPLIDRAENQREGTARARAAREAALGEGKYRDAAGRSRMGQPPAAVAQSGTAKARIFDAADRLHANARVVDTAAVQQALPDLTYSTIPPVLSAWRKLRGVSARG